MVAEIKDCIKGKEHGKEGAPAYFTLGIETLQEYIPKNIVT